VTHPRRSPLLVLIGIAMQFLGLAVDARLHSQDPGLAEREGVLALTNPGHSLFALGLALVVSGALLGWFSVRQSRQTAGLRTWGFDAATPVMVLLVAIGAFTFAYRTGSLTGHHDAAHPGSDTGAPVGGHVHATSNDIEGSSHEHAPELAISMGQLQQLNAELAAAREATAKYRDVEVARADGFVQVTQDLPGLAAHFLRLRGGSGRGFDPTRPQILLYTRQGGAWELVGVSYTASVLTTEGDPGPPPEGFAGPLDTWHFHENLCFTSGPEVSIADRDTCLARGGLHVARTPWMLHVWLWDDAPEGIFAHADSNLKGSDRP
jgi:hypothetical protein